MVLGYSDLAFLKPLGKYKYEACPKDLPVKSTWGAGGVGPAALYIEVDRLEEDVAIYKRGKINLYFPLNQIKGKYRLHKAGSISNEPGC